jgi:photosystem II stability/assembly factor-like uncharacterized protein
MKSKILLLAGTKKGVFFFTSRDRKRWECRGPFQKGKEINHAVRDPRTGKIFATANDAFFGSEIVWSKDMGKSWSAAKKNPAFDEKSVLKLDRIWHIRPAENHGVKVLYAGVAPAALFCSDDGGVTWHEISSLTQHPTRSKWNPGAGGMCLHSIVLDPTNARRMFVGISAAGVFRTDNGGKSWTPMNKGTRAEFMPVKYPEVGQCVHKLMMSPSQPSLLFQQNHCGVYRSDDAGKNWTEITKGLPSDFGFPIAVHPRKSETVYVIPLQGAEFRCPPNGKLRVFRTRNGGKSWKALSRGLPQDNAFVGMYREAMAMDDREPAGIYFGTNTGKIFASRDEGDSWFELADNLPPVYSVSISVLE